ncbi:serine/threonine protein phosphatase PrpC [Natranaerovirga hydrolytica]|uniref:Serine/threonine protein phosphatase PrpC n=1 Tax=Natranaerovirga hydrolytica TaxID=680378 RepID=A0A4R1MLZ4_9FIRM|nr:PP2C family serine/threonine-protein phosphatase [Natranaerovirga hydrolytica]TCK93110.1 serine/threonine protein phosphatase PrpC [Natranaerovirga hydrolytica]
MGRLTFQVSGTTHKGLRKKENQDSIIVKIGEDAKGEFGLFAIADGVSTMAGSKNASHYMIKTLEEFWYFDLPYSIKRKDSFNELMEKLRHKIKQGHQTILKQETLKQGTTLTVLLIKQKESGIIHIGDTRLYQYANQTMTQVTQDHTYVNDLVKQKIITPLESKKHPKRHIITQCIGGKEAIHLEVIPKKVTGEELFLICSDGLYDEVEEETLSSVLKDIETSQITIKKGVHTLLQEVLKKEAKDNISIIIVKVKKGRAV